MKKTIVDYTTILENGIAHATKKANELNPEPIGVVKDLLDNGVDKNVHYTTNLD